MNCPICGITIESGYISAYNRLCWTPDGEIAKGVTKWAKSENSIVLAEFLFVCAATVKTYHCSHCKKIFIDTDK